MNFDVNNAIGLIAISAVNAIGLIAVSAVNAVGLIAVCSTNAIGLVAFATINATGVIAFSSVNANGVIAISANNANGFIAIGKMANGRFALSRSGKGKARYMLSPERRDPEAVRLFTRIVPAAMWPKEIEAA